MDSYKIIDISFILLAALLVLEPRYQVLSQLALRGAASQQTLLLCMTHPLVNGLLMQLKACLCDYGTFLCFKNSTINCCENTYIKINMNIQYSLLLSCSCTIKIIRANNLLFFKHHMLGTLHSWSTLYITFLSRC